MPGITAALGLAMLLHYAAALLLFGAALARVALGRAAPAAISVIDGRLRRILGGAALLATLTALAVIPLQTRSMAGDWASAADPDAIATVLFDTEFGHAWIVHIVLALVAAGAALAWANVAAAWLAAASALLVASLGFIGHAVMEQGALGALHRVNHAVHLLAAGAWLGGLVPLALMLSRAPALSPGTLYAALRRFSAYATAAVLVVLASGLVNTAIIAGSPGKLMVSFYGKVLAVKLVLVAVMVILALVNRYRLLVMLADRPAVGTRRLRETTAAELVVGALVITAAVVLGSSAPP